MDNTIVFCEFLSCLYCLDRLDRFGYNTFLMPNHGNPEGKAQTLVKQLSRARRFERQKHRPMETQVPAIVFALKRKGVVLDESVLAEATRRIHENHQRTIKRPDIITRANSRADGIIALLREML